ncbi:1-deoxy-D-xylulose-5-phosphate synthase [Kitasatospora phosalacinea]|uniref:1-deoxy-D-xylulose-5-phosphate synthase n=1 Tax=Kitasatospora phosalacinea TaxID=2065 RepID=A0A9W6V4W5_9ACTN|nr:1-deoxy-D-xylulose-5-phosphate synthase [Kitasatospora phosalacinea]GLW72647.1 1-deoxy-D-xylulose-5-phosphate synthase [Kitasatospora phosalacinea]
MTDLLSRAATPAGLRTLDDQDLPELASDIRELMVRTVSRSGGHLGASLGVVELTIALHRVFDSPRDALVFDTGHQTYPHKILTGRAADFDTLRRRGGLSGYPSRAESAHDWTESSHASTSLAYADGLARAFHRTGAPDRRVVAVVGDGALTGGAAFEALNSIGAHATPVVVVLNDNTRSYDPTAGALAAHLARLRSGEAPAGRNLFTDLGFHYLGPVDGHDLTATQDALREAAALGRPVLVHTVTDKGRGYAPAEADTDDRMHACGVIDPRTGRPLTPAAPSWTSVLGAELTALAEDRPDLVALTAAMRLPVGLGPFSARFPDRTFDSGIAEQHAVTSAAGLAAGGLHPVVCLYATFLNRAVDQLLMDVALHRLPVTLVLDRAGVTGPDGASHHGLWDLALLSRVPGLRIAAPRDPARLRELLREAVDTTDGPTAVRFPKATAGPDLPALAAMDGIDLLHRTPRAALDVLLIAIGATAPAALDAARILERHGLGVTVADPRWVVPVNPALAHLADRHRVALSIEDGVREGGAGALIAQHSADHGTTPVHPVGLPTRFLAHGERAELLAAAGLSGPALADTARALLARATGAAAAHDLSHPAHPNPGRTS